MALDAISAIGLAANILQFVDIIAGLLSDAKEIYHSAKGATTENIELQSLAETFKKTLLWSADCSNIRHWHVVVLGPAESQGEALG
jgi:hypothetical protein